MKTSYAINTLAAAFLAASAASAQTLEPRYTMIDKAFIDFGGGFRDKNNDAHGFDANFFYAYIQDNQLDQKLLCSGVRVETEAGINADNVKVKIPSVTGWSLLQKVDDGQDNIAEYGSCITVEYGELEKENLYVYFGNMSIRSDYLVFWQDDVQDIDDLQLQNRLMRDNYPGIWSDLISDKDWMNHENFPAFQAEVDSITSEYRYTLDAYVSNCENAAYLYDEAFDIWTGDYDGGELPICDRLYPAP